MKHFVKGLVAASVVATAASPAISNAAPTVYGKFNLALENVDTDSTTTPPTPPDAADAWKVQSHASRFGIKGSIETNYSSLEVVYKLEWQVDVTDEGNTSANHIKSRNQYTGLKGDFGQFLIGRKDTPFKESQAKLDLFGDLDADIKTLMKHGETRTGNMFEYSTPKIGDAVTIKFMGVPGENDSGANDAENGLADATSISIAYDTDVLHLSAALDSGIASDSDFDLDDLGVGTGTVTIPGKDVDATRLVGTVKLGDFGVGAMLQTTDYGGALPVSSSLVDEEEVTVLSAYYKTGNVKLKAQVGSTDNYNGVVAPAGETAWDVDMTALGVDFSLAKKTVFGIYLINREGGDKLAPAQGKDTLGFQLVHSF